MIPLSSSDPPNLHAELGLDDSARRLLWPGTIEELRRRGFEPQGQIAQGATSVVITCKERSTGRTLVVKACYDPTNSAALELFQRERQILASEHGLGDVLPHYYGGVDQPGPQSPGSEPCQPFLLLEWIPGQRICDYIAQAPGFLLQHKVQLCAALARAVQRMHDANLVHGDISSNNVLVCRGDRIRLIDVGQGGRLARGYRSLHSVSGRAGTDGFSPASLLSRNERPSQSTDLRQCAAVVFHALTGTLAGSDPEQTGARRQAASLARLEIPAPLAKIVMRGLRDRNTRFGEDQSDPRLYANTGAFADELDRWSAAQLPKRASARSVMALVMGVALVFVLLTLFWERQQPPPQPDPAQQTAALLAQCSLLPNREHPAISRILRQEENLRRSEMARKLAGDRTEVLRLQEQRVRLLERAVATSADLVWMAPLRENLTVVLTQSLWLETAPTIAKVVTNLRDESEHLRQLLEQGETTEAGSRIIAFHRRLSEAARQNSEALPVRDQRQELDTVLSLLPPRLAGSPERIALGERQALAEQAWSAGDWAVARQLFGQCRQELAEWMECEWTPQEKNFVRQATVAMMGKLQQELTHFADQNRQLEAKVVSLNRQIQELTAEGLQKQRVLEQRLTEVESLRSKAALNEKSLRTENERLQAEVHATRNELKTQGNLLQVSERNLAEWKRHAAESDRLLQQLQSTVGSGNEPAADRAGQRQVTVFEGHEAGERLVLDWGGIEFRFRWCPPGQFRMGSPVAEPGRESNEDEVDVTLTSGFWLHETELTQRQWVAVMGDERQQNWESQYGLGDNFPAYRIPWDEVQQFCVRLTANLRDEGKLPRGWRLEVPTEAQWEYACRAGGSGRFCFGDDDQELQRFAWYGDNAGGVNHPVATRESNRWGLFDLHGSVWEWTQSTYDKQLVGGIDPQGAAEGTSRVRRGGSWIAGAASCRSATRNGFTPRWSDYLGFRPCLRVVPQSAAGPDRPTVGSDINSSKVPGPDQRANESTPLGEPNAEQNPEDSNPSGQNAMTNGSCEWKILLGSSSKGVEIARDGTEALRVKPHDRTPPRLAVGSLLKRDFPDARPTDLGHRVAGWILFCSLRHQLRELSGRQ